MSSNNSLSLNDLFEVKTAEIQDFPHAGMSRTIRFRSISVTDEQKRWKLQVKLQKARMSAKEGVESGSGEISTSALETMEEAQEFGVYLLSKYLLDDDDKPLIREEVARELSTNTIRTLVDALSEKSRNLGETSAPEGLKENSNDGSTGAPIDGESQTSSD